MKSLREYITKRESPRGIKTDDIKRPIYIKRKRSKSKPKAEKSEVPFERFFFRYRIFEALVVNFNNIDHVPYDVWGYIFSFVDDMDIIQCFSVCKSLKAAIERNSDLLTRVTR